jgi:hypothetical protein
MAKLTPRYDKCELDTLLMCIVPIERWTRDELRAWKRQGVDATGFRHFTAPNITPIERYRPKVLQVYPTSLAHPHKLAQCVADRDLFDLESLRLDPADR